MRDEQINIQIAKACGWREIEWSELTNPREARIQKLFCHSNDVHFCGWLPNYCNDLNAMHEAEMSLEKEDYLLYTDMLHSCAIRNSWKNKKWRWISLPAKLRAETFVKFLESKKNLDNSTINL